MNRYRLDRAHRDDNRKRMLLALDTSGPLCSAALHDGSQIVARQSEDIGRGHAEHLMDLLEGLLVSQNIDWPGITKIACTTGPGSFTGLRVGLATARGLALALKCPTIGVTVFEALRFKHTDPVAVVMDARRNQIWMQVFDEGQTAPKAVSSDSFMDHIPRTCTRLIGSAAPMIVNHHPGFVIIDDAASPDIDAVACIAHLRGDRFEKLKPLYLRQADAKPQAAVVVN